MAKSKTASLNEIKKHDWGKIGACISIVTLLLVAYQAFVTQPRTEGMLQQIAINTYTPKPLLSSEGKCYIIESQLVKKYFNLKNVTGNYYLDEYILSSSRTYASKPWIRITLPVNIEYTSIASEPSAPYSEKQEKDWKGNMNEIISISWDNLNLAPGSDVKVMILYDKGFSENLKEEYRTFNYGSVETGEYYNTLYCKGFEIYQD